MKMGEIDIFLPDINIPQDILWINEDIFDDLPHAAVTGHNVMATLDGDFKKLCSRKQSASTPFSSRTLSASTPANDSGFMENSVLMSFSGQCTISSSPIGSVTDRVRQDSATSVDSDMEGCVSMCTSQSNLVNSFPCCHSDAFKSQGTDSAFGEVSQCFSECQHCENGEHMDTGIDLMSSDCTSPETYSQSLQKQSQSTPQWSQTPHHEPPSFSEKNLQKVLKHFSPKEPDRLIGRRMGLDTLDIVTEMSVCNPDSLNLILSFLDSSDLLNMCQVSRHWQNAVENDSLAARRKLQYIASLQTPVSQKENAGDKKLGRLPRGLTTAKPLQKIQHRAEIKPATVVNSTLTTPALPRHRLFWQHIQEAEKLKFDESLVQCPKCQRPAKTHSVQERAWCTNSRCSYDFCIKCRNPFHGAKPCPVSARKTKSDGTVGTKKSKKNLRRL